MRKNRDSVIVSLLLLSVLALLFAAPLSEPQAYRTIAAAASPEAATVLSSPTSATERQIVAAPAVAAIPAPPSAPAVYAVGGILRSLDNGETWEVTGRLSSAVMVAAADDPNVLIMGPRPTCTYDASSPPISSPLQISRDAGRTWVPLKSTSGELIIDSTPWAIWGNRHLILGAGCTDFQVFSWNETPLGTPAPGHQNQFEATGSNIRLAAKTPGQDCGSDVRSPTDHSVAAFVSTSIDPPEGLLVSRAGPQAGYLWHINFDDPAQPQIESLKCASGAAAVAASGQVYLLGSTDGVWLSLNQGKDWTQTGKGLEGQQILAVTVVTGDDQTDSPLRLFAGTEKGLFELSTNTNGATAGKDQWREVRLAIDDDPEPAITALRVTADGARLVVQTDKNVMVVPLRD